MMTHRAFKADIPGRDAHVVLEEQIEGCYVLVFGGAEPLMSTDYLYQDLEEAQAGCLEQHGIPVSEWEELRGHRLWMA